MKIYPKLNIFLNILPPVEGMHPLLSRFVLAKGELYDEMEILEGRERFGIEGNFSCALEENLIYKAKEALKMLYPQYGGYLESLEVRVEKHIPQGGGLGGGSANAGAFLSQVAQRLEIPKVKLEQIALQIGSDVGFFLSEFESANVMGIGEIVNEFIEPSHYHYEIFTPPLCCETAKVYRRFDALNQQKEIKIDFLNLSSIELLSRYQARELNDLWIPASQEYPQLKEIAKELGEGWFFSGSGSSFFRLRGVR